MAILAMAYLTFESDGFLLIGPVSSLPGDQEYLFPVLSLTMVGFFLVAIIFFDGYANDIKWIKLIISYFYLFFKKIKILIEKIKIYRQ